MFIKNISIPFTYKNNSNISDSNINNRIFYDKKLATDTVSFKGNKELSDVEKYERAIDIVDCFSKKQIQNMDDFDQKHLEGIQYGLKTFEDLSFPQIYFLLSNMGEISVPVVRDCSGMCPACNVNGRPKERNTDAISRMDFEDFKNFTDDIKEISRRLNFDCAAKSLEKLINDTKEYGYYTMPSSALFYDSDGKDIWLKDENGKIHEFPELNKMLYEATGIKGIFDTAGWAPRNTIVQTRMEKLVNYYSKPENQKEIDQINISLNPYHGIMEKANEYKNKGDITSYTRMKKTYINNIVNAMYTCTPLVDSDCYQILIKAADSTQDNRFKDYDQDVCINLLKEIIKTLFDRYLQDVQEGNYKYAKNFEEAQTLASKQVAKCSTLLINLTPSAKNNIFSTIKDNYSYVKNKPKASFNDVMQTKLNNLLVDVNGEVYINNDHELFKTDICLNFKNKNKKTKQLYPLPDKRILNTKDKTFN